MAQCNQITNNNIKEFLLWFLRRRRCFRIKGRSMVPAFNPGDLVWVNPKAYQSITPDLGDIIVVKHPYGTGVYLIKRVKKVLENNSYYLIGDNPLESTDSRAFGTVAHDRILGQVTSRFLWGTKLLNLLLSNDVR